MKNFKRGFIEIIIIVFVSIGLVGVAYYVLNYKIDKDIVVRDIVSENKNTTTTSDVELKVDQNLRLNQILEQKQSIISVQLKPIVEESIILDFKGYVEKVHGVVSVDYTSAEKGLADFKLRNKSEVEALIKLDELGYNPIGAKFVIKLKSSSNRDLVINSIKTSTYNLIVDLVI